MDQMKGLAQWRVRSIPITKGVTASAASALSSRRRKSS